MVEGRGCDFLLAAFSGASAGCVDWDESEF